jgi:hypothetical protein
VDIGKLLIDLGIRNFFNTKIAKSGSMAMSGLLYYCNGLNVVMDLKVHIEKLELNDM